RRRGGRRSREHRARPDPGRRRHAPRPAHALLHRQRPRGRLGRGLHSGHRRMTEESDGSVVVPVAKTAADWHAVRTLCCETGNGGNPIDRARWPLFGDLWIGPYQRLVPTWTYVAEADGRVVGYLTGCPDTAAFRRARRLRVTLPLLVRIALGRYGWTPDARRTVRLALGLGRGVESRLAPSMPAGFAHTYPAHLHMNVDAEYRRQGIGA